MCIYIYILLKSHGLWMFFFMKQSPLNGLNSCRGPWTTRLRSSDKAATIWSLKAARAVSQGIQQE